MNKRLCQREPEFSLKNTGLGRLWVVWSMVLCLSVLSAGCSFFEKKPDEGLLKQRMEALVAIGWESVRLAHPEVLWMEKTGRGYLVSFKYDAVFIQDESAITEEEKERIRKFLPECVDVPLKSGNSCSVEETLLFVETDNFDWMPEYVVQFSPHLMPIIVQYEVTD